MIMPVMSLAAIYLAIYARLMRSSIIEVSHQDFIKTARAKGLSPGTHRRRPHAAQRAGAGRHGGRHAGRRAGRRRGRDRDRVRLARPRPAHLRGRAAARLSGAARHLPDPVDHRDRAQPRDRPDLPPDRSAHDDGSRLMDALQSLPAASERNGGARPARHRADRRDHGARGLPGLAVGDERHAVRAARRGRACGSAAIRSAATSRPASRTARGSRC